MSMVSSLFGGRLSPYLTAYDSLSDSITVNWIDRGEGLRRVSFHPGFFQEVKGEAMGEGLYFFQAHFTGLKKGVLYEIAIEGDEKRYFFRGVEGFPIRFIVGGDLYFYQGFFQQMNELIGLYNPDFVVMGGDIAYTKGRTLLWQGKGWEAKRWIRFLREMSQALQAEDGRLIPMVAVVGNHDVKEQKAGNFGKYLLSDEKKAYRRLSVDGDLELLLLDTGHIDSIEEQTKWLKGIDQKARYEMAVYHEGGYPGARGYYGKRATAVREEWGPEFSRLGVLLAFEHHNHTYKRTQEIGGVTYLGDGGWGTEPRAPEKQPYLAKWARSRYFFLVTLKENGGQVVAINPFGQVIDQVDLKKGS